MERMTAERRAEIKAYLLGLGDLGVGSELLAELEAVEGELKEKSAWLSAEMGVAKEESKERWRLRHKNEALRKSLFESQGVIRSLVGVLKFYIEGWPYHKEDPTDSKETV